MNIVENVFPKEPSEKKVALVFYKPGELEDAYSFPIAGVSAKILGGFLRTFNLRLPQCFLGLVNQVTTCEREEQDKLQLRKDLETFQPDIVIIFDNETLTAAGIKGNIASYRGTVFIPSDPASPFFNFKCMPTFHPSYVLRGHSEAEVIVTADLEKALQSATSKELQRPQRTFLLNPTSQDIITRLNEIIETKAETSFDIEGGLVNIDCCSVSCDPSFAFIIPFSKGPDRVFPENEEMEIWRALSRMLMDPEVPKVLQNSLYDRFVLAYRYHILIRNVKNDTMLKHWELYCEMEKGLGFQTSFYTNEPYYKSEIKGDHLTRWAYCCKDSAVTLEISRKRDLLLKDPNLPYAEEHYQFNMAMLNPILYMELKGMKYNYLGALARAQEVENELAVYQDRINSYIGIVTGKQIGRAHV